MLTQTAEIAIKAMIFLATEGGKTPTPPREIADAMGCSPSYLAKILGDLSKAGVVRSTRGAHGGASLARSPEKITLLDIVEASQGLLVADYCMAIGDRTGPVCAFHRAMWEVYVATRKTLQSWTLARLAERPVPTGPLSGNAECRMAFMMPLCGGGECSKDQKGKG